MCPWRIHLVDRLFSPNHHIVGAFWELRCIFMIIPPFFRAHSTWWCQSGRELNWMRLYTIYFMIISQFFIFFLHNNNNKKSLLKPRRVIVFLLTHMDFCIHVDVFIKCRYYSSSHIAFSVSIFLDYFYNCADYSIWMAEKFFFSILHFSSIHNAAFLTWICPHCLEWSNREADKWTSHSKT